MTVLGFYTNFEMESFLEKHGLKKEDIVVTPIKRTSCFIVDDMIDLGNVYKVERVDNNGKA